MLVVYKGEYPTWAAGYRYMRWMIYCYRLQREVSGQVRQKNHGCLWVGNQDGDQNITDHVTDHPNSHVHVRHLFVVLDINSHASDTQRDTGNTNKAPDHRVAYASHTADPRTVPAAGPDPAKIGTL